MSARLRRLVRGCGLSAAEKSLASELALGALRRRGTLDAVLKHFLARPDKRLPKPLTEILHVGLYRILFLDRVPDHAAVNEAVRQATGLWGYTTVFWTANISNYAGQPAHSVKTGLVGDIQPGGICLLHNGEDETVQILPDLLQELKRRGFSFIGPTTAYAFMQAMGIVNDHIEGCAAYPRVAAARAGFTRP